MKILRFILILAAFAAPLGLAAQTAEQELAYEYFKDGEFEPALELYQRVEGKPGKEPALAENIAECYLKLARYEDGLDYLDKAIRNNAFPWKYELLKADFLRLQGQNDLAVELEKAVLKDRLVVAADYTEAGSWLYQRARYALARDTYLQGRAKLKDKYAFALELAGIYAILGEYGTATEEYLLYAEANPMNQRQAGVNILGMVRESSKEKIEAVLLREVQKSPTDINLRNLVFEFYVLVEDFREAFVQVKSIDRVFKESGQRVYQFALTLRNNKEYGLSNEALDYIIEKHPETAWYYKAVSDKTVNSEIIAFEKVPVDTADIRTAVRAYDELLDRFGRQARFFDAIYRKSNLLAFYLFQPDEAMKEIQQAQNLPLSPQQKAKALLLQGDIHLMKKEFNRSRMLYEEVARMFPEGQIGAEAKFRDGRLSYFEGDFEIAQARLKSIKDNTTNDISNDAIQLFLLIQDAIGLDSTTAALQLFAEAQMRTFQHDYSNSLNLLDSLLRTHPQHPLTDEVYWEKANIYMALNDKEQALLYLDRILMEYREDILADDALFTMARIYDYSFQDKDKAMDLYIRFLREYTGSLYIVEVRKRIRELREERS